MAAPQDQFVQIPVAATEKSTVLNALDSAGNVWWFDFNQQSWRMMSQKRQA